MKPCPLIVEQYPVRLFLELTAREWPSWVRALHDGLDGAAPGSAGAAELVADVVARGFGDRPLFCDLLAHTPLNLERNVSPEAVRSYKLISLESVGEILLAGLIPSRHEPRLLAAIAHGCGSRGARGPWLPQPRGGRCR